jgi:hypothetical protein
MMNHKMQKSVALKTLLFTLFGGLFLFLATTPASANHSWGGYHWARKSNPFTLKLGDNLSSAWKPYLNTTSSDWSISSVLDTTIVPGNTTARRCRPTAGMVEVCNYRYGNNGWLGIAQVWVSGSHITQGTTKLNDTYFNTTKYNTPAWRSLVMCQEVGHTLGLDHQDENFSNTPLGSCMDYSNDPNPNQHPNAHDYSQLESIYAHLDTTTTVSQTTASIANGNFENRSDWGKQIRNNGKVAVFEKDFGGGHKLFTFVVFAEE